MAFPLSIGTFGPTSGSFDYGGAINTQGFGDTSLAGRFASDLKSMQPFIDAIPEKDRGFAIPWMLQQQQYQYERDPKRLTEQFQALLPVLKEMGAEKQRLGFQANLLGAGLNSIAQIPNTINSMRQIPLYGLQAQAQQIPNIFGNAMANSRGFSSISDRLS